MNIRMGWIRAGRMGKVFAHTLAFTVKDSFFGDMHGQSMDAVEFFTQKK